MTVDDALPDVWRDLWEFPYYGEVTVMVAEQCHPVDVIGQDPDPEPRSTGLMRRPRGYTRIPGPRVG